MPQTPIDQYEEFRILVLKAEDQNRPDYSLEPLLQLTQDDISKLANCLRYNRSSGRTIYVAGYKAAMDDIKAKLGLI